MRIDKDKLDALCRMPDDELWCEVCKIAKSYGFTLPNNTPSKSDMQKLRGAVSANGKINLANAVKILNEYKRRENK